MLFNAGTYSICILSYIRYDELRDMIRTVKNSQKIKDVAKVQTGESRSSLLMPYLTPSSQGLNPCRRLSSSLKQS